jgi:hypothetical protein
MSIRNLDWSPLGLHADPVRADPDAVRAAQMRYQHIATTIDDVTARLQKIVDTTSDELAGQYVGGLRADAGSIKDRLDKAAVRYHDVADEIGKYEPQLDRGLSETAGALTDAGEAQDARIKALSMPDAQKDLDGTLPPAEQEKGSDKNKAVSEADSKLAAARQRLNNALDALNEAGKRFADAVNCKKYKDGLTDSLADRIDSVMAQIARIFGFIGMGLAALAILIPGVNVLGALAVAGGVISLVASIELYAHGKGSIVDVVLGAVGLGMAGLGAITSLAAKGMANAARSLGNLTGRPRPVTTNPPRLEWGVGAPAELQPIGPAAGTGAGPAVVGRIRTDPADFVVPRTAATEWMHMSEWFNNPATNGLLAKSITPDMGFWQSASMQVKDAGSMWATLFSDPLKFTRDWSSVIGGVSAYRDLSAVMASVGGSISPLWYVWGGVNGVFRIGGLVYTSGRLDGWIPAVRPPGVANQ